MYGDSKHVIEWANKKFEFHNMELTPILKQSEEVKPLFVKLYFKHIFQESNCHVDNLWKDSLLL